MPKPTKIRGHHLLCLKGFQGYGYNEEFIENMGQFKEMFEHNPDLEIEVVNQEDVICNRCPHSIKGICNLSANSDHDIRQMDDRVLEKLKIQPGYRLTVLEIFSLVDEIFKTRYDLTGICLECRWHEKCLWYLAHQ